MEKISILLLAIIIAACSGGKIKTDDKQTDNTQTVFVLAPLPAGCVSQDLSETGIPATIAAPKESVVSTMTYINNEGDHDMTLVKMTEDSKVRLGIYKTKMNFAEAKNDLTKNMFNKFDKFQNEDENSVLYTSFDTFHNDSLVYDFMMIMKNGNDNYYIKPDAMNAKFTKDEVLLLYSMAKSISFKK